MIIFDSDYNFFPWNLFIRTPVDITYRPCFIKYQLEYKNYYYLKSALISSNLIY